MRLPYKTFGAVGLQIRAFSFANGRHLVNQGLWDFLNEQRCKCGVRFQTSPTGRCVRNNEHYIPFTWREVNVFGIFLIADAQVSEIPNVIIASDGIVDELNGLSSTDQIRCVDVDVSNQGSQIEFENTQIAVRRRVVSRPSSCGGRKIVPSSTTRAYGLVNRAVLVKAGGSSIHMLI